MNSRTNQAYFKAHTIKIMILLMLCIAFLPLISSAPVTTTVCDADGGGSQVFGNFGSPNFYLLGSNFSSGTGLGAITSAQIWIISRTSTPSGIKVELRTGNGTIPNSTILATGSLVDASVSTGGWNEVEFDTAFSMDASTEYWIVWTSIDQGSETNVNYYTAKENTALCSASGNDQDINAVYNPNIWANKNAQDFGLKITTDNATINVVLDAPIDEFTTINDTQIFNATVTAIGADIQNATLYIWNSTGVFTTETNLVSGTDISNSTSWGITDFIPGAYEWNVFGCVANLTGSTCQFTDANRSFNWGLIIDASISDNTAFETDTEVFQFNITVASTVLSTSATLNYNGTVFSTTVDCDGNECSLTSSVDIPLIATDGLNQSFFFEATLFTASTSASFNLSSGEQNVSQILFDVCSATLTTRALNFTVFDEQTTIPITPFYIAGEFDFWLGTGDTKKQLAFTNLTTTPELGLCISPPDRTFSIDDTIEYNDNISSSTYNTRNYYFQQDTISNATEHIPLFLLNIDDSTSFILKVQDTNLLPVANALIHIQRLDIGTGNFTTVQISKTDDNGQTVGFFKTETVDYRFMIIQNGVTLLTTSAGKVVPETAPFTLTFTVGADPGAPWILFEDLDLLTQTLTFNDTTAIVSFGYIDTSTNFTSSRLLVTLNNLTGDSTTICDVTSTQSTAILTCDTGNVSGTYTASAFITRGGTTFLVNQISFNIATFSDVVGLLGVFLAWFIILISAFAFKFNEIAGIVLMNLAVIMVNIIGLVNFGYLFIFGMMGVSIIIMVMLKK